MSREKILKYFKDINHAYNDCTRYDTLKRMLDELQEPCDDAISRQAVAQVLLKYAHRTEGKAFAEFLVSQINDLPSVTQQQRTGRWITSHIPESMLCECSECGFTCGAYSFNYCPNCGCKMQEVEE